jgi:hypothetical protein
VRLGREHGADHPAERVLARQEAAPEQRRGAEQGEKVVARGDGREPLGSVAPRSVVLPSEKAASAVKLRLCSR